MNPRRPAPAAALAALAATLASPAWAVEQACPAPVVNADSAFVARFPDLLEQVRSELSLQPDLDACARVELRASEADTIQVSVTLPDGRTATRNAARRDEVLSTLQALLLVPKASPTLTAATPVAPRSSPRLLRLAALGPTPHDRDAASPALEPRSFGIELSLLSGARMGEGQLAVGVGALSLVEVRSWLFGFAGRTDRYQTLLSGDPEMALELGILAGKRWHFPSVALDFTAGPAVAMKGLAFSQTEMAAVQGSGVPGPQGSGVPGPPIEPPRDPSTGPVPRLLLGAHAGFTPRSVVRSFVGMEARLGPGRASENPDRGSSHFPVFELGMVLGGTMGTK